jgi:4-amino-4-deoxy-L-arabinose transferase-like glycosyltransferase
MITPKWKAPATVTSLAILVAATVACLLPFVGKAFHIDDPLFVWCARQIQSHPFDFYGFNLNWEGREASMSAVTQNPPLAAYCLALVGALFGWSEAALHAGFLLPAVAAVLGTYLLARHFCSYPLGAALVTLTAPVFLVSSSGVMCDTMMVALWVWSVLFWIEGLKAENPWKLCLSALLIAGCCLTKYFGISLVPLLLVYSLLERRRFGSWLAFLAVPVVALALYQYLATRLYGQGLLLNAISYATDLRVGGGLPSKILVGLAFSGGCMVVLLLAAPLLWGWRGLAAGSLAVPLVGLLVVLTKKAGVVSVVGAGHVNWLFVLQFSVHTIAGASLIFLATADVLKHRTPASALLVLWVTGTFAFACAVNWTVSGRNILPMLPAVSLLLIRRLEARMLLRGPDVIRRLWAPLGASLVTALLVTQADCRLAGSARAAASTLKQELGKTSTTIWFEGHWGFQYYMEEFGGKALDKSNLRLSRGDAIVIPLNNSYLFPLPAERAEPWFTCKLEASKWLTIMSGSCGAGFYSDGWGPLPFVFCPAPPEEYLVFRVQ